MGDVAINYLGKTCLSEAPVVKLVKLVDDSPDSSTFSESFWLTDSSECGHSDADTTAFSGKSEKVSEASNSTPVYEASILDENGNILIDICVDQSFTDDRKTVFMRVTVGGCGTIPPLDPGGPWTRRMMFTHQVDPADFVRLVVLIEARVLRWYPGVGYEVYCKSSTWPVMSIDSNTEKRLSITAMQLANGELVCGEWCGTSDHITPLDGQSIPGALQLQDVFQDEETGGGRKVFELFPEPSYLKEQKRIVLFPNREFVLCT